LSCFCFAILGFIGLLVPNGDASDFGGGLSKFDNFTDNTMQVIRQYTPENLVFPQRISINDFNADEYSGFEIEYLDDEVMVSRPFQMCRLMVQSRKRKFDTMGAVAHTKGYKRIHILQYETEEQTREAYQYYLSQSWVDSAMPDFVVTADDDRPASAPVQTYRSWGGARIGAPGYYDYLSMKVATKRTVVVAVLDTGITSVHPEFAGRIVSSSYHRNYSIGQSPVFLGTAFGNYNGNVADGNSHGTHVSGIITDITKNTNVKILPIKVLTDEGPGGSVGIVLGMAYVSELAAAGGCDGAPIVAMNMSLGGTRDSYSNVISNATHRDGTEDIIAGALSNGVVTVVAAGNNGQDIDSIHYWPASCRNAVTVASIDSSGVKASSSNWGSAVNIAAPGVSISAAFNDGYGYVYKSGTSMATPHVAAVVGLWQSDSNNNYTATQIVTMLQDNAVLTAGATGWTPEYGYGCVNANIQPVTFNINAIAGPGGSITSSGNLAYAYRSSKTFTFTADSGYLVDVVTIDGAVTQLYGNSYTFSDISANHTIDVTFKPVITITAAMSFGGTMSPYGNVVVDEGASQTFVIQASPGHCIHSILINDVAVNDIVDPTLPYTYTFTGVTSNQRIDVHFRLIPYDIVASAGSNGSMTPNGTIEVSHGTNRSFQITPDQGYIINQVLVDGVAVPVADPDVTFTYTFVNVTAPHTISATFKVPSTDSTLTGLVLTVRTQTSSPAGLVGTTVALSPVFDPDTYQYTATVSSSVTGITINPSPNADARNVDYQADIDVNFGGNLVLIRVTAEDKSTATYRILLTRTARAVTSVSVQDLPLMTVYEVGDTLNLSGLTVLISYDNGETLFAAYGSAEFDLTWITTPLGNVTATAGSKMITVRLSTFISDVFSVTVKVIPTKQITDIKIKVYPFKVSYKVGDTVSLAGLVITVNYNTGASDDLFYEDFAQAGITYTFLDGITLTEGPKLINVYYQGKESGFAINVSRVVAPPPNEKELQDGEQDDEKPSVIPYVVAGAGVGLGGIFTGTGIWATRIRRRKMK
jgi:hypothetical protein